MTRRTSAPVDNPFLLQVDAIIEARGVSKGAVCDAAGKAPRWFSEVTKRVERGTASVADLRMLIDAVARDEGDAGNLRALALR